jgi:hypothetical protein
MAAILITVEIINFGEICLAIGDESIYVLAASSGGKFRRQKPDRPGAFIARIFGRLRE